MEIQLSAAIIIPFRDRGTDPNRAANLKRIQEHWHDFDAPIIIASDGRWGNAQFNRSAAYNNGTKQTDADILIYTESDMLINHDQIWTAVAMAAETPGLVIPFHNQKKLNRADSRLVRAGLKNPEHCATTTNHLHNYGCINIISRDTLNAIGQWDETFEGNAHDDCAMWHAFNTAAGPMRWVDGNAYHLYHTESVGTHTTQADKNATARNYRRMQLYVNAKTPEQVRHLTAGGQTLRRNWRGQLV